MRSIFLRTSVPVFCLMVTFIVSAQLTLFPFKPLHADIDPSVFLYIGRQMHGGAVPYIDLFDHKGSLLYFIQYVGFLLTSDGYTGVWLLEVLNYAVTCWFVYLTASLFTKDRTVQFLAIFATLVLSAFRPLIAEGGNIVEEYALPWIASSLYIFLKYFKTGYYRFYEIVLLGLGFAAVCLLRLNMIAVWMMFLPVTVLYMLIKKKYRDLWVCIAGFVLGMAILCIPTLLYLLKTDSLEAMIAYYLQFNFGYSDVRWLQRIETSFVFFELLWLGVAAAIISLLAKWKDPLFWLNAFCTGITLILCSLSGRGYHHYALILLPLLTPFFVWAIEAIYAVLQKLPIKNLRFHRPWSEAIIMICCAICTVATLADRIETEHAPAWSPYEVGVYLTENTHPDDDVLILGNFCRPYLEANRSTDNKFFYQTPPIDTSDALYDAFIAELERVPSDVIVVPWPHGDWKEISSRIGDICAMFDAKAAAGEYTHEDHGSFYVYRYKNGKDNNHG